MTDTRTDRDARGRRVVIAIIGCAALAVIAVTLLLLIGMRNVPDLPTVHEQPDPPVAGRLAIQHWDDADGMCIDIEELDNLERRSLFCENTAAGAYGDLMGVSWFGWDEEGQLLLASYERDGVRLVTLDVDTGDVVSEEMLPSDTKVPEPPEREDGSTLATPWSDDGHAVVKMNTPGAGSRTLYEVHGPDGYSFWEAMWSPRGDYALVHDSEGRWIVLSAEGDPAPRILSDDADRLAWYQPA